MSYTPPSSYLAPSGVNPVAGRFGGLEPVSSRCMWLGPSTINPDYTQNYSAVAVLGASNATPVVLSTNPSGTPNLVNGMSVYVNGVGGNAAANGTFYLKQLTTSSYALYANAALTTPVAGTGAYTSGGTIWPTGNTYVAWMPVATNCTGLRLVFANWGQDPNVSSHIGYESPPWSAANIGGTVTITASIKYNGAFVSLTFNGLMSVTVDPGGTVVSDPLYLNIQTSIATDMWVYSYVVPVTPGTAYALGACAASGRAEGVIPGNATSVGGSVAFNVTMTTFHPVAVLGVTSPARKVSLALIGDSRIVGYQNVEAAGSAVYTNTNDQSYVDVANNNAYGMLKLARVGDNGYNYVVDVRARLRRSVQALATHVLSNYGINDLTNQQTAGQVVATHQALAAFAHTLGQKYYVLTMEPRTTSTDNWVTAANQTVCGLPVTAATNANPVTLTGASSGVLTNDQVTITGATGGWAPINGTWAATATGTGTFTIPLDSTAFGPLAGSPVAARTHAAQYAITWASNATPVQVTTASPHPFATGNAVLIYGVLGNLAANGEWAVNVIDPHNFTLNGSAGGGAYTSGGFAQPPSYNGRRLLVNFLWRKNWQGLGFDGVFDVASCVEVNAANSPQLDGGYWLTNATSRYYTYDGVHCAHNGYLAAAAAINLASLS